MFILMFKIGLQWLITTKMLEEQVIFNKEHKTATGLELQEKEISFSWHPPALG